MGRPKKSERGVYGAKSWRKWSAKAWLSDLQVQLCSLEAKGLWIDMLNLMMESPRVGFLLNPDGSRMGPVQLSHVVRQPVEKVESALAELKNNRVYSVDRKGAIFNRRMVREENEAEIASKSGTKSVENRERDQQGRLKPWANPGAKKPTRDRERDRDSLSRIGRGDFVGGKRTGKARTKTPWTLDQKREFAWKKVAEAIGVESGGWDVVVKATEGDAQAIHVCKRVAREIGVTWYAGKPDVKA